MVKEALAGLVAVVFALGMTTAVSAQTAAPQAEEKKPAESTEKKAVDKKPAAKKQAKADKKPADAKAPATAEKKDEKPVEAKK
jgi:hypothetical protein